MDFSWNDEIDALYAHARQFATEKLNRQTRKRDRCGEFDRQSWEAAAEFGFQGLCLDKAHGGLGLNTLHTARIVEALGKGCEDGGLVFSICAHLFACAVPVSRFATNAVKTRYLSEMITGRVIGANAITEADAGSDVHALRATAEAAGDTFVINGVKNWVTNAPVADAFVVFAKTDPKLGYMGISAFLVDRNSDGLRVGTPMEKIGLRTSPTASLYLEDCVVPAAHMLGQRGQGALVFKESMQWERACLFAAYIGQIERQLERSVEFARARRQFGKAIASNQSISHRLANGKIRLEAARLLLYRACWARDRGEDATLEIAMAKASISEAAVQAGLDAIQVLGGNGVTEEYDVERWLRDAIPSTLFSGTSEIQRNIIAAELGL